MDLSSNQAPPPPPKSSLPSLPNPKVRKPLPISKDGPTAPTRLSSLSQQTTKLRAPSTPRPSAFASHHQHPASTPNVPTLKPLSSGIAGPTPRKPLRKTVSIAAFPQPPKTPLHSPRSSSGSANFGNTYSADGANSAPGTGQAGSVGAKRKSKARKGFVKSHAVGGTPSLLNGSGNGKAIPARMQTSEGFLELPSPPQSRSSSPQGSYSTTATTFEEDGERRPRSGSDDTMGENRRQSSGKEGKGNVLVSVRVRPDSSAATIDRTTDGEWMVDGRRSLMAYRGKEGGDYYYGKSLLVFRGPSYVTLKLTFTFI